MWIKIIRHDKTELLSLIKEFRSILSLSLKQAIDGVRESRPFFVNDEKDREAIKMACHTNSASYLESADFPVAPSSVDHPTLRDQMAIAAMQSMLFTGRSSGMSPEAYAEYAYEIADAMLRARGNR